MKFALIAALALAVATPVISLPTAADAQVRVGRGGGMAAARRTPRAQPPRLSTAEQDSLYEAQDLIADLDAEIAELERIGGTQEGGHTEEQRSQIDAHAARRAEAQTTADRLIAKRGY